MKVERRKCRLRRMMHSQERRYEMGNTLRYEGFRNVLLSQMRKRLSGKLGIKQISRRETVKNNDTVMEMLLVELEDGRAAPTLYLEDLYKAYREGATLDEILQGLCEMFTKYSAVKMPLENKLSALIDDFEKVKPLLKFRLVNGARNKRRMEGKPFSRMGEFLLAYQIQLGDGHGGIYATQVTDQMLREWGIDEAELHDIAVANMDLPQNYLLQSMEKAIGIEVDPSVKPEDRPEMFILTSKMKINGATVIFSEEVRQKVGKQLGGDYYLLPSSIHEWVVIPKRCARSTQEMEDMVQEVNEDAVEEEEFLSDHVYEYDVARAQMRQAVTRAVLM